MKRLLSVVLSMMLLLSVFASVGCRRGDGEKIDPTKDTLIVGLQETGYGREFMDEIIKAFNEDYPNIQVILRVKPDAYLTGTIKNNIATADEDVYLCNQFALYDFVSRQDGGSSDLLADITDIVMEGGEGSAWNRMHESQKDYYNYGTADSPKIFAMPYAQNFWGLFYDKDLFKNRGFYTLSEYKGLDCIDNTDDDLWGPDGISGTYDDGLPATFEDFKALVVAMTRKHVVPFTWTGSVADYRVKFLNSVIASYEGAENFLMRYNWNGEFNGETITKANAYKLTGQEGVKAMLSFADFATSNTKYFSDNAFSAQTHTEAQDEFVASGSIVEEVDPIGFLLEATWWEWEARNTIARRDKANFGFLPFPKFIGTEGIKDQTNDKTVLCSSDTAVPSAIVINKKSQHMETAKKFVKYYISEKAQAIFTSMTGINAPYKYSMSEEQLNKMTTLAKDIYNYSNSENVEVISLAISNPDYQAYSQNFKSWSLANIDGNSDALKAFVSTKN